ncbi:MAG: ATP-binding protein [Bacteroidota bacterium]
MRYEIENNSISAYKRLSYDPWYAFAELVDNSTQAYFDNREILDAEFAKTGDRLCISIEYNPSADKIVITDNSIGMNETDLIRAFKVGKPPENPTGRSKYGLGMKTASCWFGDKWSIKSKKLNEVYSYEIFIDVDAIARHVGEVILPTTIEPAAPEEHYTILTITDLNRKFVGRTLGRIKQYLSSIYRFDISEGTQIKWNEQILTYEGYEDELYVTEDGVKFKKLFEFEVNGKSVSGWVGVLGRGYGSRKKAGFSLIQNKRVIQGSYKPTSIFGDQDEGSNDLVNQRVVGELFLNDFSVSHTKDKIIWEDDEESLLDEKLGQYCNDAKQLALTLRFNKEGNDYLAKFKEEATTVLTSELKSNELTNYIKTTQPYPEKIIELSYTKTLVMIEGENLPDIEATIGSDNDTIYVLVYFSEKSEFEPYVLTQTTIESNKVIVMINMLHPHVQEMTSADSLTNFIRHSIYDGVAEWKAIKLRGSLQPNTIKFIKDGLLRIPFEIKSNKMV